MSIVRFRNQTKRTEVLAPCSQSVTPVAVLPLNLKRVLEELAQFLHQEKGLTVVSEVLVRVFGVQAPFRLTGRISTLAMFPVKEYLLGGSLRKLLYKNRQANRLIFYHGTEGTLQVLARSLTEAAVQCLHCESRKEQIRMDRLGHTAVPAR